MISVQEFRKQFIERHEFQYDDINYLASRYNKISFKDIPQAWVCCIDEALNTINNLSKVLSVSQIYGFPVIQYENDINDRDFSIIQNMEKSILCIDIDLHNEIGEIDKSLN